MSNAKPVQRFALSDELWEELAPLLPTPRPPSFGGGRPPLPLRVVADAIFFVLRTGCQWKALTPATHGCGGSSAHRYFQQWVRYNVFERFWTAGLQRYDEFQGIDWEWLSMDGAMTKAPLGGEKNRTKPN